MAAKSRSTRRPGTGNVVARELDQLKRKVKELTVRLEREAKARKLDARLAAEAKKTRAQLTKEITAVRGHGRKLASQLKSTLGDASKREQALKEARAKIAELKEELGRKTADLRRKSGELRKLAEEAAHRATAISRGDAQRGAEPVAAEPVAPATFLEPGSESHETGKPTPT
jgi:chromosome segregation ATPase